MFARRGVRLLAGIIGVIALPSVVALGWYSYTKDPTLRPLGITKAALIDNDPGQPSEVIARVKWGMTDNRDSGKAFAQSLVRAFDVKQVDLRVIVTDSTEDATTIIYEVGASRIGPYPKDKAVKGVNAAIAAYHMLTNNAAPATPEN